MVASLVVGHGLKGAWASVTVAPGLGSWGSRAVEHELSRSSACGIFLDQRSNPGLLHWQADSLPLSHKRSPLYAFFEELFTKRKDVYIAVVLKISSTSSTTWLVKKINKLSPGFISSGKFFVFWLSFILLFSD